MRTLTVIFSAALAILLMQQVNPVQVTAAAVALAPVQKETTELQQHIQAWTDMLTKQPEFKAWKSAQSKITPLGPGTHGWLVTFLAERKSVGYMIVNATTEGGYQLGEYGVGAHPAFDSNTLYNALIRQGLLSGYSEIAKKPLQLERLYVSPMLAAWKWSLASGETYYLDAWTGEALPINDLAWQAQTKQAAASAVAVLAEPHQLTAAKTNKAFDPYERLPWLTGAALSSTQLKGLPSMLDQLAQVRYTAQLFKSAVLYVFPAVGYHRWNDSRLFVAFDLSIPGTRYIPLETLQLEGSFYQ